MGVLIGNVEMMNYIMSNLPEEYENINGNIEYEFNDDIDTFTINIIWDKLSAKYDRINVRLNQK